MEPVNTKNRPFNLKQQSRESLKGKPTYYRLTLHSAHRISGDLHDCVFDTHQLVPGNRVDLLDGCWEIHVESFQGRGVALTKVYNGLKICLPELRRSSNDFASTADGVMQVDDSVALIAIKDIFLYSSNDIPVEVADSFSYNRVINEHDIGMTIDPQQLFSGQLRVKLRLGSHVALPTTIDGENVTFGPAEHWTVRLLCVHKPHHY